MGILDTAKLAYELASNLKNIELKEVIQTLREEAIELREENLRLRESVAELERRLSQQADMGTDQEWGYLWRQIGESGDEREGPYCSPCWHKDKRMVQLTQRRADSGYGQTRHFWQCEVCKHSYGW